MISSYVELNYITTRCRFKFKPPIQSSRLEKEGFESGLKFEPTEGSLNSLFLMILND